MVTFLFCTYSLQAYMSGFFGAQLSEDYRAIASC